MTPRTVRLVARLVDAPFAVLVHGTRAWRAITRTKCPLCMERTRYLNDHVFVNHIGEQP